MARRLSKSKFQAGRQCHKLLWWKVHEPDAPELTPSPEQQLFHEVQLRESRGRWHTDARLVQ